ncbi:unnamed protein product [Trichogramma brassicae]|uniref:Integrase catalytic domain-containing protein n=1 Tax=Trichogramma brassicae TaxID=86971 RepID=A0A6H5IXS3_9HYME|nr:unnamed protein product [Trichogramma brassicae]
MGREYCNQEMRRMLEEKGIQLEATAPYTPEQNGQAERDNRTIVEMARSMMIRSGVPDFLWAEAVNASVYILNRLPTSKENNSTPFEAWWRKKPDLSHMKVFGTLAYAHIPKQFRKKFDGASEKTWLVGYEGDSSNYRLYKPSSRRVIVSRNVTFDERIFYRSAGKAVDPEMLLPVPADFFYQERATGESRHIAHKLSPNDDIATQTTAEAQPPAAARDENPDDNLRKRKPEENPHSHVSLRDRSLIKKIRRFPDDEICIATTTVIEPCTYEEAISGPDAGEWQDAIDEELRSLEKNCTWTLVPKPEDRKVIDSKWVFRVQEAKAGKPKRFKARLCARGFRQGH